jgi:hypothetical protein
MGDEFDGKLCQNNVSKRRNIAGNILEWARIYKAGVSGEFCLKRKSCNRRELS